MYIFTSGFLNSANNKQWFKIFNQNENLDISILISDCDENLKKDFYKEYNNFYNIIFFKKYNEMMKTSFLKRFFYLKKIAKKIDEINPDIIHIHGCYYTYLIKPLFFIKSEPKIIFNVWGSDFNLAYFNNLKQKIIMSWLFKKSNLIWANWFAMADNLKNHFPKYISKIKTILWGIESDIFEKASKDAKNNIIKKYNLKENDFLMISTKGFVKIANQHKLVNSIKFINPNINFKLILHCGVKNEEMDKILYNIIKENKLSDKVIISHNFLTNDEIKALFEIANLSFVIPSMDQLTRAIFETILADTNLILSDIKPYKYLKEIYNFNFDLVDVNDEKQLAKRIEYYIKNNPKPNWDYEKTVIKRVMNFENKAKYFIEIYKNLLEGK
jgi:hypothetical protein